MITFNGGTFFNEDQDIVVEFVRSRADRTVAAIGTVKRPFYDKMVRITFSPAEFDNLATLMPYGATKRGANIHTGTDKPIVITPLHGAPLTVTNVFLLESPSLKLDAQSATLGQCQLIGLLANDGNPASESDYFSFGSAATGAALTGLDLTKLINATYKATYNGVDYYGDDGFQIDWATSLTPRVVAGYGTITYMFDSVSPTCAFTPSGPASEAAYAALLAMGTDMGEEPPRYDLTIAGPNAGDPLIVLDNMDVSGDTGGVKYGTSNRYGSLTFQGARSMTSGLADAAYTVGVVSA